MKSGKQRRSELQAKKEGKRAAQERAAKRAAEIRAAELKASLGGIDVNTSALAPNSSYSSPRFLQRGYYIDSPFQCQRCGKQEVWTAAQQKWWYEVAKGNVWTHGASVSAVPASRARAAGGGTAGSPGGRGPKAAWRVDAPFTRGV